MNEGGTVSAQKASSAELGRYRRYLLAEWEAAATELAGAETLEAEDVGEVVAIAADVGARLADPEGRLDRRPLEIDIVAESVDGKAILLGEAKWSSGRQARAAAAELVSKARTFPLAAGRSVHTALWLRESAGRKKPEIRIVTPTDVLRVLR